MYSRRKVFDRKKTKLHSAKQIHHNSSIFVFKCCTFCILLIFLCSYIMIFYAHHITCYLSVSLCVPYTFYISQLTPIHAAITSSDYDQMIIKQYSNRKTMFSSIQNSCKSCNSSFIPLLCQKTLKFGILLGQRHGGTNYFMDKLKSYSSENQQIYIRRELLLGWEHQSCSPFANFIQLSNEKCNAQTFISKLDEIFSNFVTEHKEIQILCSKEINGEQKHRKSLKTKNFFFWKLQMEQLHPSFYSSLVEYLHCHSIMVIQLIRQASIASFWSWQSQIPERVMQLISSEHQNRNFTERIKLLTHNQLLLGKEEQIHSLTLDANLAAKYVKNIDTNREYLRKMIKFYKYGSIKHQQFDYEDIIGPYSKFYWKSILAWIGIDLNFETEGRGRVRKREHPLPCFAKIENWNEVKKELYGTDSYYACEKSVS